MEDSLRKRYLIKLIANITNGLVNMVLVAIVPKYLGPIAYGQFTYIQQFFSQVYGFLSAGTSAAFYTKLSANPKRIELIKAYFIFSFIVLFIVIFLVYLLNYLGYKDKVFSHIPTTYIYMGVLLGFLTWISQSLVSISDANAITVSVEYIKVILKVCSLGYVFYLANYYDFNLETYIYYHYSYLVFFICAISILFVWKGIFNKVTLVVNVKYIKLFKEFKEFCTSLVILNGITIVYGLFDLWLLQKLGGIEQTGYYGLAYAISAMCFLFTSAMTPIITREFAKEYASQNFAKMRGIFYKYIPMLYAISAFFSVFISFQSEQILMIFTDDRFYNAFMVLSILAYYPVHQTYGQLSGSLFYVTEQTNVLKKIGIILNSLGFILTLILLYFLKLEAVGLALKLVVIQLISVNIQLHYNCKLLNGNYLFFIKHQVFVLVFFVFNAWIATALCEAIETRAITKFLLSGAVYTLFSGLGAFIMPKILGLTKADRAVAVYCIGQFVRRK